MSRFIKDYYLYIPSLVIYLIFSFSCAGQNSYQLSSDSFIEKNLETVFEFSESNDVFFRRISDLKTNARGEVFVRDFFQKTLFIFDENGNFKQRVGREGAGPGEFGLIGGFVFDDENEEVIIFDRIYFKIEIFSFNGNEYEHKSSHKLNASEDYGKPLAKVGTDIIIQKFPILYSQSLGNKTDFVFSVVAKNGKVIIDTLFTFQGNEALIKDSGELLYATKPQGTKSYFSSNSEGLIYAALSDSLTIYRFNIKGEKTALFSHSLEPVPIPVSFKDSLLNTLENPHKAEMRKQFPENFPLITNLVADNSERLWVELNSKAPGKGWFVFSKKGVPLFYFKKPAISAILHSVRNDKIMWSYLNEKGAPTFALSKFDLLP